MPQYEYICEEDGEVMTLLRSMRDADAPVADPAGRGRTFRRRHSTFIVGAAAQGTASPSASAFPTGGCACGNPHGPCSM